MREDWIVGVLSDLRIYSEGAGLSRTAAALEEAGLTALLELSVPRHLRQAGPGAGRPVAVGQVLPRRRGEG